LLKINLVILSVINIKKHLIKGVFSLQKLFLYQKKEELDKLSSSNYFLYRQNIELFGEAKRERLTI
jgi:hypothetical protein